LLLPHRAELNPLMGFQRQDRELRKNGTYARISGDSKGKAIEFQDIGRAMGTLWTFNPALR
jgi:hypothetical protein